MATGKKITLYFFMLFLYAMPGTGLYLFRAAYRQERKRNEETIRPLRHVNEEKKEATLFHRFSPEEQSYSIGEASGYESYCTLEKPNRHE